MGDLIDLRDLFKAIRLTNKEIAQMDKEAKDELEKRLKKLKGNAVIIMFGPKNNGGHVVGKLNGYHFNEEQDGMEVEFIEDGNPVPYVLKDGDRITEYDPTKVGGKTTKGFR